jgi:hypothetical protein
MEGTQVCSQISRERTVLCEGKCMNLTSMNSETGVSEEVEELQSNQKEADTKIMLQTSHTSKHSPDDATVTIRSPDNDVFVLLLYFCQKIPQVFFDTGSGDKCRLLDVNSIIADTGNYICMALPALHALVGCDSTSAFVAQAK